MKRYHKYQKHWELVRTCLWEDQKKIRFTESRGKEQTWLVSSVSIVTSSIRKILGKSVMFEIYTSEVGANDWINAGCFSHSFDIYEPLYPYFCSISTNLSSYFFPSAHLTCCNSLNLRTCEKYGKGTIKADTISHIIELSKFKLRPPNSVRWYIFEIHGISTARKLLTWLLTKTGFLISG